MDGNIPGRATALPKRYLNAVEAATFIGAAAQTLAKWRCNGGGPPFIRLSRGRIMYAVDDLIAWMDARRVTSTSEVTKTA